MMELTSGRVSLAPCSDLPVQASTKYELVSNLKTGTTSRADEVRVSGIAGP
jgi:hypothetical protein